MHGRFMLAVCIIALTLFGCIQESSPSTSTPYSLPTTSHSPTPTRYTFTPTRVFRYSTPQPTQEPEIPLREKSLHWQMAEAHVEAGGAGRVPVTQETELSLAMDDLLGGISSACGGSEYEVATLSLAAQITLFAYDVETPLLDFMDSFYRQTLYSSGSCEDVALLTIVKIHGVDKILEETFGW